MPFLHTPNTLPVTPSTLRVAWLTSVAHSIEPWFASFCDPFPPYRVSVGFPKGSRGGKAIGQCHSPAASAAGVAEIFIHPKLDDPLTVAAVLCHEMIHAGIGTDNGHGPVFRRCALALGLKPPMKATTPGPDFIERIRPIIEAAGRYPHAALNSDALPKQKTHMMKLTCPKGYVVRTTKKHLAVGFPFCPCCRKPMSLEML